ncbi:MAG: Putative sodium/glutamine symporter GlnT [Candidatus Tokpelaia hoelldobleri]|uniref:Sodium/glutamine symporter GlnT n=1 Tax=Candidatus Tokpelaia hoelldobleri TaxID=1902579 RepID=A0A1U9JVP6_9HYPH|nr:MAG: Putative sodium/glutamine symporter GlnT [Candidatus Tokpelaia hoelldoblerii]
MMGLLTDILLNKIMVVVVIGLGLWFTITTRFVQFRYLGRMFNILWSGRLFSRADGAHISSFQALMLSIAGLVGGGNIAGVAVAITLGGPGAVFWMWVAGLLGMATSFIECTLAQAYKRAKPDGGYRGGPAFYITHGIGSNWRWLAALFSVLLLATYGFGFNGAQSHIVVNALHNTITSISGYNLPLWIFALGFAGIVGIIIAGGVQRIVNMADVLVPIMAVGYIFLAMIVLGLSFSAVPATLAYIVKSAFGLDPALGGGIGVIIAQGVRRGLFSNEAGLGSAPNVAAVAEVRHPAAQGIVQAFSVFINTIIICTCTALIILLGGLYNAPEMAQVSGVVLTQNSLAVFLGEWGRIFVSVALSLFVFTTVIYNCYLGENSLSWLSNNNKPLIMGYRVLVVALCVWGGMSNLETIFSFADLFMALLAMVNLFALVLLLKPALQLMRDYDRQLKAGIDEPVFDAGMVDLKGLDPKVWPKSGKSTQA